MMRFIHGFTMVIVASLMPALVQAASYSLLFESVYIQEISIFNGVVGVRLSDTANPVQSYSCASTQNSGYVRVGANDRVGTFTAAMTAYSLQVPVSVYIDGTSTCDGPGWEDFVYPNTVSYPNSQSYPGQGIQIKAIKIKK